MENEVIYDQRLFNILHDNPEAVCYLKRKYQTDQVWKYCIEQDPKLFSRMKNPSPDMCVYALDIDGSNIITMKSKFSDIRITPRMAYIALRSFPGAILYIPQEILNEEMFDLAFDAQPSLIAHFTNLSHGYLIRKIRENPSFIRYIVSPGEELICIALSLDPNLCVYISPLTPKMIQIIQEKKPELAQLYANSLESENVENAENTETRGEEFND